MKYLQNISVRIWLILFVAFFFCKEKVVAQNADNKQQAVTEILRKANQVYGPNEMLENGKVYIPDHPKAKEYPYYLESGWMDARLILKGDIFIDLHVKYNVCLELLILKKEVENQENHIPIVLNNNFIESFDIKDHHFINLNTMSFNAELSGFAELIYQDQLIFLVKHTKEFLPQFSQSNPYGAYSKLSSNYYIYKNDKLTRLNSKKAFLNYFEPFRKDIKKYMRQNNIKYKKASSTQLYNLIKYCDEVSRN